MTGANTTDYVLDGDNAVRTLLNGAVDKTWFHGARGPEYERTGSGSPLWYLYDGLGSVLGTVDGSGNLVNTRKYDVYGAVRSSTGGSGPKHKFVGALGHPSEDETGLVYMRARYMDPVTGRFASEDPYHSGHNWFTYQANDPTSVFDRSGKFDENGPSRADYLMERAFVCLCLALSCVCRAGQEWRNRAVELSNMLRETNFAKRVEYEREADMHANMVGFWAVNAVFWIGMAYKFFVAAIDDQGANAPVT